MARALSDVAQLARHEGRQHGIDRVGVLLQRLVHLGALDDLVPAVGDALDPVRIPCPMRTDAVESWAEKL